MTALTSALLAAAAALGSYDVQPRETRPPDCPTVVRVLVDSEEQIAAIASWTEPWEVARDRSWLVLGVHPAGRQRLEREGLRYTVDHERTAELCAPRHVLKTQDGGIPGFPCYRTVPEVFATASTLADDYPELASWIDIGDSWEQLNPGPDGSGFDLMVLRLTNSTRPGTGTPTAPDRKPALVAFGGIHAREYAPPEILTRFAEELVHGHGTDPDATWLLDEHEIHLVLLANPDGRIRAQEGVLWRKNADNDYCSNTPTRGVDLNRNFEHFWDCCGGSSGETCNELYRGPYPSSEPEVRALQDYLRSVFPDHWTPEPDADTTGIFLDVHSYGELMLFPWGATSSITPNHTALQSLARKMAYLNSHFTQRGHEFYAVDGNTMDFAYGELGVASYIIEVGTTFFEPCLGFERLFAQRNLDALWYAARVVRTPYVTPSGPEVEQVVIDPNEPVAAGRQVQVTAQISDDLFSNEGAVRPEPTQSVAAAEVYLARPPWSADAPEPIRLEAADGAFDDTTEEVTGWVDTTDLAPGRHLLFFRGQDADGVWGPVKAEFLRIGGGTPPPRRPSGRLER